jgi:hypothetical protein
MSAPIKATIMRTDDPKTSIKCMFNPKEYAIQKQNSWNPAKSKGANFGPLEFEKGAPATLQLSLFFDTYEQGTDVRSTYTDALWKLMLVDEKLLNKKSKKGRPPKVRFQWGNAWGFEAVITSMTQRFTLFLYDGTPVRATVDVSFTQVKDDLFYPPQNPTSGGVGGGRVWAVRDGDTLAWIAYQEYGDSNQWRQIADANHLTQVRTLRPGMMLEIPSG